MPSNVIEFEPEILCRVPLNIPLSAYIVPLITAVPFGLKLNPGPVFPAIVTLGPTMPFTGSIVIASIRC